MSHQSNHQTKGNKISLETAKQTFPFLLELYETQLEFQKTLAKVEPQQNSASLEDKFAEVIVETLTSGKVAPSCPKETAKIVDRSFRLIQELQKKGKEVAQNQGAEFAAACAQVINEEFIRKHQLKPVPKS